MKAVIKRQGNILDGTSGGFFPLPLTNPALLARARRLCKLTRCRLLRGFCEPPRRTPAGRVRSSRASSQASRGPRRTLRPAISPRECRRVGSRELRRAVPRPGRAGRRDRALKMRLPRRVAAEAVKDSKRSLIDPEGVPGDRSGLLGDETLGACKKCGDLLFLPRLCLQRNRQGDFLH